MQRRCSHCGSDETMPFTCRYCGQPHCASHRLPENHECPGLEEYKEQLRERGQLMAETPKIKVEREIQDEPSRTRGGVRRSGLDTSRMLQALEGRTTMTLLAAMVGVTVFGWVLSALVGPATYLRLFALHAGSWRFPWTLVTSLFAHAPLGSRGLMHLFFNGLILFFFGPAVERRIGTRDFLTLFLVAGVIAGIVQLVFALAMGTTAPPGFPRAPVLGASGAILALMGTLVVLEPDLTVLLFFVIPLPLWLIVALIAVGDTLMLVFAPLGGIANLAHLVGLGIGLLAGKRFFGSSRKAMVETWGA